MIKRLKKFLPVLIAFGIFILPFGGLKAFAAYSSGYVSPIFDSGSQDAANTIDGDINTSVNLPYHGVMKYKVNGATSVRVWGANSANLWIQFYDSSGAIIGNATAFNFGSTKKSVDLAIPSNAVTFIVNNNMSSQTFTFYEVEVLSSVSHTDISSLSTSVSGNNVTLNYSIPSSNPNFTGSKIYRDGTLIATQGKTTTSYIDKSLAWGSTHTYKVTATYDDNYETTGVTTTTNINVTHDEITNLTNFVSDNNNVTLHFSIPSTNAAYTGAKVYKNGTLVGTLSNTATTFSDTNVSYNMPITYKVTANYVDGYETTGASTDVNIKVSHDEISNLTSTVNKNNVTLNFSIPSNNQYYNGANVYRNGVLVGSLGTAATSFTDSNVPYDTPVSYKVTAIYLDGYETTGVSTSVTVNSPKPVADVTNLKATTTDKEVDLSFDTPNTDQLLMINVYKDGSLIGTTTGNSFIDKNVKLGTSYTYKVTTVSVDNVESVGVSVKATTKAEQPPVFKGTFTQGPNGDYTLNWTSPTTGTVKIVMAGQTLATVPASNGSYTIPKAAMKVNAVGDPEVTVQPISESGLTGNAVPWPSNASVPFSVTDLIKTGNGLLWLISPFVLLALAFLLVPKLRRLLFSSLGRMRSGKKEEISGRRTKEENERDQKEKQEREPRKTKLEQEPILRHEREPREVREARAQFESAATKEKETRSIRQPRMSEFRISKTQRQPRRTREARAPRVPRERRGN